MTGIKHRSLIAIVTLMALLALFAVACANETEQESGEPSIEDPSGPFGSGSPSSPGGDVPFESASADVTIEAAEHPELGEILTDGEGRTVYMLEGSAGVQDACTGPCAEAWPPVIAQTDAAAGDGLDSSLIGTTEREDGQQQVTYNGVALYYFQGDVQPGDANGHSLQDEFGVWRAVSPDGSAVT
ncbi:MAG: hypothetical protein L0177_17115 [Chloroflexi bacterium]|nr:hypothetical protein [Chloroflexota bacterium]